MCLERAGVCLSVVIGERARERAGTGGMELCWYRCTPALLITFVFLVKYDVRFGWGVGREHEVEKRSCEISILEIRKINLLGSPCCTE